MTARSTPQPPGASSPSAASLSSGRKAQHAANGRPRSGADHVLASLRATQIVASKPVLPAELIATILDYLPVADLLRAARVSRRLQEMVYDDTRWIQKLKALELWNEGEARQRVDEALRRRTAAQRAEDADELNGTGDSLPRRPNGAAGNGRRHAGSVTLFDAGMEEHRYRQSIDRPKNTTTQDSIADGFDEVALSPTAQSNRHENSLDPVAALVALRSVRSVRGKARQEFAKVYGALAPLYFDLARSHDHSEAALFHTYRKPEEQAQILTDLKRFASCDHAQGWLMRSQRVDYVTSVFQDAVLREFKQAYQANDTDGGMHRYAHVLHIMHESTAAVEFYIASHPVLAHDMRLGDPLDCLEAVAPGHVDLNPSREFFTRLASTMVEQAAIIDRVFPPSIDVLTPFLSRLCTDTMSEYLISLFDEAHVRGVETYVKAVSGTFDQALRFVASLTRTKAAPVDFPARAKVCVTQCYERHIDMYLAEELAFFKTKSEADVSRWEKDMTDLEASADSFFMSNISRQAAKRDFLSSFKKVVMMPVNVLPAFPLSSPFASTKSAAAPANSAVANLASSQGTGGRSTLTGSDTPQRPSTPVAEPPTTELAAKAAIMNSRLEGIRSLFSIEVALSLTHFAKVSLERAASMVRMDGRNGEAAREQCEAIFVTLLHILGDRHVKAGFDKAVGHLGSYNPRQVREFRSQATTNTVASGGTAPGVEPLVTFLELVNVGDLIQQMVDVFYAQELVATKLTDRDDFLDPAVKEKKRFEQMLDERVAAGLNKGIDVLMDEVEYICATTQLAADYNPSVDNAKEHAVMDIGPSSTANQVIDTVGSHTGMLVGSTDKNMLDVFTQEVGLRLFGVLCKHFKRQRISVDGAIKLISDINHYSAFITSLRQKPLVPYFQALRELGQIYLVQIDPPAAYFSGAAKGLRMSMLSTKMSSTSMQAKELATIIADAQRYHGVLSAEEVYEFAERRADWYVIKEYADKHLYGGCNVM